MIIITIQVSPMSSYYYSIDPGRVRWSATDAVVVVGDMMCVSCVLCSNPPALMSPVTGPGRSAQTTRRHEAQQQESSLVLFLTSALSPALKADWLLDDYVPS